MLDVNCHTISFAALPSTAKAASKRGTEPYGSKSITSHGGFSRVVTSEPGVASNEDFHPDGLRLSKDAPFSLCLRMSRTIRFFSYKKDQRMSHAALWSAILFEHYLFHDVSSSHRSLGATLVKAVSRVYDVIYKV